MAVSYKKLWKLLIDKDMKKSDLEREAGITHYALSKLSQGKDVSTEVLGKICAALGCTIDDIMGKYTLRMHHLYESLIPFM